MALRLADHLLYGELFFKPPWSVHGYLALRGWEMPVSISLTGNSAPDLQHKHIRFEPLPLSEEQIAALPLLGKIHPQQIGATGTMTAEGWVRVPNCSLEEMLRRHDKKAPIDFEWVRRLYLEWFGPNGCTVIELADPLIEYEVAKDVWEPLPIQKPKPRDSDPPPAGLSISIVHADGLVEQLQTPPAEEDEDLDDPLPEDLQRRLDRQSAQTEKLLHGIEPDGEDDDPTVELELMDHLIDNDTGTPIVSLFDKSRRLPNPDDLNEEDAETVFKMLVGDLAMCGIALHVCEHFTGKQAYRWLIETVMQEGRAFKQLRGTGWTQNFMTSEDCPECEAEADREFQEREQQNQTNDAASEQNEDDADL